MKTKRKILSVLVALCMLIGTMSPIAMAALAADGEPALSADGYYEIATADELYWFADKVNNGGNTEINGRLTADIVINKNVLTAEGELNGDGSDFKVWTPICNISLKYKGIFDGQNHTVSGLYFNDEKDYVGLFGYTDTKAQIKNVGVIDSYIKGKDYVGGVCGQNYGTITNCYNTGAISGNKNIGGVCGTNGGTITNCYNTGTVSGNQLVGGVCGYKSSGTITNCYNTGAVSGTSDTVGGVCGRNYGTIENCYYLEGSAAQGIGSGTGEATAKTAEQFKSGEVCYLLNSSTSNGTSIWRQNIENYVEPADASPVLDQTHAVVKFDGISYYNDFTHNCTHIKYDNGFCTVCGVYQPAVLNGDIYEIGNAGQLYWFADKVNNGNKAINGRLTADIVINENVLNEAGELNGGSNFRVWTPIGNSNNRYEGVFNGQNHTVSGLYFNDDTKNYVGLFGYVDTKAQIENVGVIDSYIKGKDYVGGVCGQKSGTITSCYNSGAVSGNNYVGGVCGQNYGTITSCYNAGAVSGNNYVGGVYGATLLVSITTSCYNTGTVSGNKEVGGVCGRNNGTIENCYNTGAVSGSTNVGGVCGNNPRTIKNCYYLEGSTAQGIGSGTGEATSKTAEQFASGEVCYLLNGSKSNGAPAWRQNIENYAEPADASPVLDQTHAVVKFDGTFYYNDCTHIKYDNGFCTDCGAYQPAVLNGNTYEIGNAGQLYWFANEVNSGNTAFNGRLTADIVINENVLTAEGELNGDGSDFRAWMPIGNDENRYAGVFDGQNHTVSGLYFNDDTKNNVGLFGYTDIDAQIKNVGVIDSYIKCKGPVGGVCGSNNGTITSCYNSGAVSGNQGVGGVCGGNGGTITNCYNTATVSGNNSVVSSNSSVGGVCGTNNNGTITNCYNSGAVNGNSSVGGVYGSTLRGTIKNCYNTATVSGNKEVGGVCGTTLGTIENCYNTGAVSGSTNVGGVCGSFFKLLNSTITNCYYLNTSAEKGIGNNDSGEATAKTAEQFKSGEVAYLLNGDQSSIVFKQSIGTDDYPNFTGAQVYKVYKYDCQNGTAAEAYSNTNEAINITEHKYDSNGFCSCGQYQPAVLNDAGVYEIGNAGQLYWFAALVNGDNTHADFEAQNLSANAVLTADIVINENVLTAEGELNGDGSNFRVWTPIGNDENWYVGVFDGQNHTVSGLYFNDDTKDCVGLFGFTYTGSKISNVGVIDSYIKGEIGVGGVCGITFGGTIENCYNNGAVSGSGNVGGVCGANGGTITSCYNSGAVSGSGNVGGVCGNNSGTIENCYNIGTVSGDKIVGGVCGVNSETCIITSCYNTGTVSGNQMVGGVCAVNYNGTIKNCYNTVAVSGNEYVGGVCAGNAEAGIITNCYNIGTVSGTSDRVGGVCGLNFEAGIITSCYNTGAVRGNQMVGGVCGDNCGDNIGDNINNGIITNCYNSGAVSGNEYVGGVCGYKNSGTITSCYYLDTAYNGGIGGADVAGSAEARTAAEFASGEVCYLLNGDQTNSVFKQTVGTDNFPSFTGLTLYAVTFTDYAGTNADAFVYGNEGGVVTVPAPYNSGYAFKDSTGSFVTLTVFGTENVKYTAVPAPTYTVTIPESTTLDEADVDDNGDYVKTDFDVSAAAKWLAGNEKTLTVSVESANGYQMKVNGAGTGVPYAYISDDTAFTADNKTVLTLTDDDETKTASGTLKVNKADVIYAGTFTDILTFTIALN